MPTTIIAFFSKSGLRILAGLAIALVGIAPRSYAESFTVPPGLAPGSQYRLVFVTADFYHVTSTAISTYNTDVNNEADAVAALHALGTTWLAIGSTDAVNAIDNIGQDPGVPIYNLQGQLVAKDATSNSGGLFSSALVNPVAYDENGHAPQEYVATGSLSDGDSPPPGSALGDTSILAGFSGSTDHGFLFSTFYVSPTNLQLPLYAVSEELTVPTVPEPSTLLLLCTSCTLLLGFSWLHKRV